uniref:Uncharacterized protein n=1 Tax=Anguilla anguilla TaxID=7936 RepID=A0A0E9V5Z5_ANGAN
MLRYLENSREYICYSIYQCRLMQSGNHNYCWTYCALANNALFDF